MYPVNDICKKAQGQWEFILQRLDISTNRKESPCPACGGNTRYRFDDKEGRGTHHCSHCGAGDGLNLIMKVKHCTAIQGAKMIADIISLPLPERTSKSEENPQIPIADKVAQLVTRAHMGESTYLNNKGLHGSHYILEDGSLLLPLQTIDGTITGAQIIKPNGEKRLIAGTKKSRSYIPISKIPENPDAIVITEGYATALTVNLLELGSVVAAVDAGNLLSVAEALRKKWPKVAMYIAGDNDFSDKEVNVGKESANKAAFTISAVISIPPTDYKCDWNDYYQKHGFLEFKKAFVDSASLPEEPKGEPKIIEEFKNNVTFLPTSNTNKKSNPDTFIDIREEGVYLVEKVENEKTGKVSILMEEWLCSKMNVVGLGISGREHYIARRHYFDYKEICFYSI